MEKIGLVLEGGGMRGVYSAGVLDYLLEQDLHFPYVIGVSAGACNASSYISKQIGRNKKVTIDYIRDPRYLSYRNWFKEKSMFGMDFIFDQIPRELEYFDFSSYEQSDQQFIVGATDCYTGKPVYFAKDQADALLPVIRASSSLPFFSPIVQHDGYTLLDGGVADPIPVHKAIEDGNTKNVLILTQPADYRKNPFKWKWLAKKIYPEYQGLVEALVNRHLVYNETLDYIAQLEKDKQVFVIRPESSLQVKRMEKNEVKLRSIYERGYQDTSKVFEDLMAWI
ncbi:MAG: patatin family protein [Paenibacillus sp. RIFOXYA1_FULL_44_5]|nr:MAG: patatin family protein [Paenibacillus sp. RIFOXYA1_FULL_44_5]